MTGGDGQGLSESWVIFKVWDYRWQRPRGLILEHRIRCVCIFPFPLCTCISYAFHIFSAINTCCFFHSRRKCFLAWQELHRWRRKKSAKSLSSLSCVTAQSDAITARGAGSTRIRELGSSFPESAVCFHFGSLCCLCYRPLWNEPSLLLFAFNSHFKTHFL